MNAGVTVYGAFLVSSLDNTGSLWATAAFPSPIALVDDDILKVTYTVTAS
jgi:hypothetical protein